jgi:DNA-binding LacI/PurR family transcriptional regulator
MVRKKKTEFGGDSDDSLYRLEDLAELAGVSISTVSRALNNSPLVSDRTKKKILSIAQSNKYEGRLKEKIYVSEPTNTISVVIPQPQGRDSRLSDPFLLDLIGGIGDALKERGCDLLISHLTPTDMDSISGLIGSGRTDALIFLGQSTLHNQLNMLAASGMPFVVWGAQLPGQQYCTVGSDNLQGGHRATRHLLRLGKKRIAFVGDSDAPEVALRLQGYKNALEEAGVEIDPRLIRPAHFYPESAMEAIEVLLERDIEVDGIVAASDMIAMGAMRGLVRHNIRVPEDVSVIGYDDVHVAAYSSPALTTIRQDVAKAGRLLVGKALRMLEGEAVRSALLPAELIVRESCGA